MPSMILEISQNYNKASYLSPKSSLGANMSKLLGMSCALYLPIDAEDAPNIEKQKLQLRGNSCITMFNLST